MEFFQKSEDKVWPEEFPICSRTNGARKNAVIHIFFWSVSLVKFCLLLVKQYGLMTSIIFFLLHEGFKQVCKWSLKRKIYHTDKIFLEGMIATVFSVTIEYDLYENPQNKYLCKCLKLFTHFHICSFWQLFWTLKNHV